MLDRQGDTAGATQHKILGHDEGADGKGQHGIAHQCVQQDLELLFHDRFPLDSVLGPDFKHFYYPSIAPKMQLFFQSKASPR